MKNTPFVALESGEFALQTIVAGIPNIALITDGLTLVLFKTETKPYITIDNAIKWHEAELQKSGGTWRTDFLEYLKIAKNKISAGKVEIL